MKRAGRVVLFSMATLVTFSGVFGLASPAMAIGEPKFSYTSKTLNLRRISEAKVTASARFQVSEDGAPDELIGYVTVNVAYSFLSKDGVFERWKVADVTFTNPKFDAYGSKQNKSKAEGSLLELYNDDQQLVARFDFRTSVPTFRYVVINQEPAQVGGNPVNHPGVFVGVADGNEFIPTTGQGSLSEKHPVQAFAYASTSSGSIASIGSIAGETYVPYASVFNYSLKTDGSAGSAVSKEQAQGWFSGQNLGTLSIERFEEAGNPPYIDLPGSTALQRPALRFVLAHIGGEGSGWVLWGNVDWLIFEAYLLEGGNATEKVPNIFLVANDEFRKDFIYDADITGVKKGKYDPIPANFDINRSQHEKLLTYIYNHVPKDPAKENCGEEAVYSIGPNSTDDYRYVNLVPGWADKLAGELNGNCITVPAAGWAQFWGVTVNSAPFTATADGGCSATWIVTGGNILVGPPAILNELGINPNELNMISRAAICIYDWVVNPIVDWATSVILYAAGIARSPFNFLYHA